jgi:glycine/D-amino acid oxidase-like deaminating enzyme/nitrite reductase/ring-hydroxylating ferredoxin subunit
MSETNGMHQSPWAATMPTPDLGNTSFRPVEADVVVVGAGITGLTTALLLQQTGRRIAAVEGARLGNSVTVRSTVKVTVGHTLYSQIVDKRGRAAAQAYADANSAGLQKLLGLVRTERIDCDLQEGLPHVIYAESDDQVGGIEAEAQLARDLGLPVALTDDVPLPFSAARALRYSRAGGSIIEGVRVTDVDSNSDGCRIQTPAGDLRAEHVVVATQYPVLDRGAHFSRLKARRSYGVAGVLPDGVDAGMTMNVGSPTHSTRTVTLNGDRLLIVVGEGHEVGHVTDTGQRWTALQDWARDRFGVTELRYHWSAEEVSSMDKVPFVGQVVPGSPNVLTATAFDGWGMTNGTATALMLRDVITGVDNPWMETFNARRAQTSVPPVKEFIKHNVHVAKTWLKDRVGGRPEGDPRQLQPGDAAILEVDGEQTAAYRSDGGELHAVSAVCTHLGCTVEWNGGEKTWDCPCHGSRFGHDGAVLHGPATTPLPPRNL